MDLAHTRAEVRFHFQMLAIGLCLAHRWVPSHLQGARVHPLRDVTRIFRVHCQNTKEHIHDTCCRSRSIVEPLAERLWTSEIHGSRIAAELRRTREDRRLLASLQVPGAGDDLSPGQSFVERAPE